ncbi:MAG: hypothetical protein AAGA03_19005 [Planctomycetota bacterium]
MDDHNVSENHFDVFFGHSLGLMNQAFGDMFLRPEAGAPAVATDPTDLNGADNIEATQGTALGAPRPDNDLASATYPWLNWNNRPFVSESELLQVPAWSSADLLRKFSSLDRFNQVDPYINEGAIGPNDTPVPMQAIVADFADDQTQNTVMVDAEATNRARYRAHTAMFGSLQNMLQSSSFRAYSQLTGTDSNNQQVPVPVGAPNFHRLLDYVHTPSRFVSTDTLLDPVAFSVAGNLNDPADDVFSAADPRSGLLSPFNRVPNYREPGKININTLVGRRSGNQAWSDVFDGLMHRLRDSDPNPNAGLNSIYGHFGPAWRDVVTSRRGYVAPPAFTGIDLVMDNNSPTFFGNPFRSGGAGDLVPLTPMVQRFSIDASMLRSHPYQPGQGLQWGGQGDNNQNGLMDDTREAIGVQFNKNPQLASVPLFSELSTTPAVDATRNSAMHTMPLTRVDNMTTTRSGVFAIWVTVGYFEVLPAPNWNNNEDGVVDRFTNQAGGDADRAFELYKKVYPQGYQLGRELGSETGDIDRHRGFYLIDRTRPSAFKPGEDVNVENTILLRRRIE